MATRKPDAGRFVRLAPLRPAATIGAEYSRRIGDLTAAMQRDTLRTVAALWREHAQDGTGMDASLASQARIAMNALMRKWEPRFAALARTAADKMVDRTLRNSAVTIGMSLGDKAKELSLDSWRMTDRLGDVVKASTEEAANLIRLLPAQTLGAVQGEVMRAITDGRGLADLVPQLKARYQTADRHAQLTAQDQVRKAASNINAARMRALGIKRFEWVHSGGGQHPREDHVRMDGKVYELDKPPLIGRMYGQDVYGLPSTLPNCRCVMACVLDFDFDDEEE